MLWTQNLQQIHTRNWTPWVCTALAVVQGHSTVSILADHLLLAPNIVSLPMIQAAECGVKKLMFELRMAIITNIPSPEWAALSTTHILELLTRQQNRDLADAWDINSNNTLHNSSARPNVRITRQPPLHLQAPPPSLTSLCHRVRVR